MATKKSTKARSSVKSTKTSPRKTSSKSAKSNTPLSRNVMIFSAIGLIATGGMFYLAGMPLFITPVMLVTGAFILITQL